MKNSDKIMDAIKAYNEYLNDRNEMAKNGELSKKEYEQRLEDTRRNLAMFIENELSMTVLISSSKFKK